MASGGMPRFAVSHLGLFCMPMSYKNSAEVDIAPAFGEITTACNVGQAKQGHGECVKSGQLVYAYSQPSLLQRNVL